jgi:hypothetical protein
LKPRYVTSVLLVTFILTGCAEVQYHPVDSTRIISRVATVEAPTPANILVKRYKAFRGGAMDGTFTIDGQEIVKLSRGETYSFQIKPGKYSFGVKSIQAIALMGVPFFREVEAECEPGQSYEYVMFSTGGTGLAIDRGEDW